MGKKVEVKDYGAFTQGGVTIEALNTSLDQEQTNIGKTKSKINEADVFEGPIADSVTDGFSKLDNMIKLTDYNFSTIAKYLKQVGVNYQSADKANENIILGLKGDKLQIISGKNALAASSSLVSSLNSEIGKKIDSYPGRFNSGAWCADFVSHMLKENGYDYDWSSWAGDDGKSSIVGVMAANGAEVHYDKAGAADGRNYDESYTPRPGDVFLINNDSDSSPDHTGFVIKDNGDGTITTIEGNTSDKNGVYNGGIVEQKTRNRSDIYCYATPSK